ncbi:SDR family oxidoreductase [Mycolicibacterium grossiae]|uniref:Short-chain dehydrogenase n=1 Tax=Mycolicibacterium grossiae TaxID=1552759 RepID=A0A1E8Q6G2_9MYCO|nr:SDR family oxidoreductase [Mycolicibacterium grossiae]OFJ54162.1 short-chain dehydrogenase [Mycolicibacterium grossiae]QEM44370.1 SDR family NAD(P)-dependent oxidoreductase [Mycolicibacterium grossiae]
MTERLDGRTILITGANGGLGQEFVRQGLDRGARRVYAAARTPRTWDDDRVVPLRLDLTDAATIADAAASASDVDLVVNNAAIAPEADRTLLSGDDDVARSIFETNVLGPVRVTKAFAPVLAAHGGGAILNVLSLAAWTPVPTAYAASKAAAWSASNAMRIELAAQGTTVTGLIVGMIDTAMGARFDLPKSNPADVVAQAYDGVATGAFEVLADEDSRTVKSLLSGPVEAVDAVLADALAAIAS